MKILVKSVLSILACLSIVGCSSWATSNVRKATNDTQVRKSHKSTSAVNVLITESDIKNRKYTVLGDVEATVRKTTIFNSDPTKEQVNEKLKQVAAKMGADAVILVRYGEVGVSAFSWGALNGKGRAIVYND